ncbi:daptide-type RiPP biosynthesis methyltransferase [Streptomyces sp. AK02-01A]|uniref:daptide-type RiPP biosynthesis methyltransferase n=1 Tax=Streptomyces sp. AK02-01A TaxID=3028648 RepID=UPI0029A87B2C|nr:daptide-type RiPP biosynthesis methyltransferase [Streptomyces sp. AK02-01A]MDX3854077.1 class I SAM-dependent methyltransferase [Streptomyces sp. AK02-01A]
MAATLLSPARGGTPLTGRAARAVAELGERAVLCDLYDEAGAPIYHDLAGTTPHEVRELLTALRRLPGAVLDLAAGSGRLTFPFLGLGRDVTALELSTHMIGLLRGRLATTPPSVRERCTPVRADMSDFALGRRFGAVVLGTTSISLLPPDARPGLYRCVREHLAPGGRFLLTTVEVDAVTDGTDETEIIATGRDGRGYRMIEQWSAGDTTRTVTMVPVEPPADGPVTVATTTIGVLPASQVIAELEAAGYAVRSLTPVPGGGRHHDVLLEAEALR